jgi:CRP-like cAMP-binding protein
MAGAYHHREFVKGLKLFRGFHDKEIDVLLGVLNERQLQPDEVLFVEGAPGNACYVIASGRIRVSVERGGTSQELAILPEGSLFGQVALIDGGRRSAACSSVGQTTVLGLARNEFDLLFGSGSTFAFKFLDVLTRILVGQLRNANNRLADVAAKEQASETPKAPDDPDIQDFFKDLAARTAAVKEDDFDLGDIEVVYSQADLARRR